MHKHLEGAIDVCGIVSAVPQPVFVRLKQASADSRDAPCDRISEAGCGAFERATDCACNISRVRPRDLDLVALNRARCPVLVKRLRFDKFRNASGCTTLRVFLSKRTIQAIFAELGNASFRLEAKPIKILMLICAQR